MFCVQAESLGVKSDSVILSVGVGYFDETNPESYDRGRNMLVKFDVKDQIKNYSRKTNPDTISWWKSQSEEVKNHSLMPTSNDLSVMDGIDELKEYVKKYSKNNKEIIWSRGYFTPVCLNSLFESAGQYPFIKYNSWRDIRTAIDMTKETANGGYCDVPNYEINKNNRHIPHYNVHSDIMMLLFGV